MRHPLLFPDDILFLLAATYTITTAAVEATHHVRNALRSADGERPELGSSCSPSLIRIPRCVHHNGVRPRGKRASVQAEAELHGLGQTKLFFLTLITIWISKLGVEGGCHYAALASSQTAGTHHVASKMGYFPGVMGLPVVLLCFASCCVLHCTAIAVSGGREQRTAQQRAGQPILDDLMPKTEGVRSTFARELSRTETSAARRQKGGGIDLPPPFPMGAWRFQSAVPPLDPPPWHMEFDVQPTDLI